MRQKQAFAPAVTIFALTAALSSNASATCAVDGYLTSIRDQVVSERFPALAASPPAIYLCTADHFPPGVVGTWDGRAITIPDWTTANSQALRVNVAHELAHAAAQREGCRDPSDTATNNHGRCFHEQLMRAGLHQESARVAAQYGTNGGVTGYGPQGNFGRYDGQAGATAPPLYGYTPPIYAAPRQCWTQPEFVGEHCGRRGCRQHFRNVLVCN